MQIKTKYEVGDSIYYIETFTNKNNSEIKAVVEGEINEINIKINKNKTEWLYFTSDGCYREDEVFNTYKKAEEKLKTMKGKKFLK